MTKNIERLKTDLEKLVELGELLDMAMVREVVGDKEFEKHLANLSKEAREKILKRLPNFKVKYEEWYSSSLVLLEQLLPARVQNFVALYEKPRNRKSTDYGNYMIQDYLENLQVTRGPYKEVVVDSSAAVPKFRQQIAILKAATARFESSLFEIKQLVQADLFDSELDAARELHKHKFLRAAGAISGVVLEKHLHQVCEDHTIKVAKKHPGIGDLNELLKKGGVIEVPQWRHISMLADLRNLCDHNKQKEPSADQVADLIEGTEKIIKTVA